MTTTPPLCKRYITTRSPWEEGEDAAEEVETQVETQVETRKADAVAVAHVVPQVPRFDAVLSGR